jgi:hypothetical protein
MDGDRIEDYIERLLAALEGIHAELARLDTPASPPAAPPDPDPVPMIAMLVLAVVAVLLAGAAVVIAGRALRVCAGLPADRDAGARRRDRGAIADAVRRYSEALGVEAVTGRPLARGEDAATVRSGLERRLGLDRETGTLELLQEVAASRSGLADLPRGARAAANGLAALTVEWSIDRWVANPEQWMRDHAERHRLRSLAVGGREQD